MQPIGEIMKSIIYLISIIFSVLCFCCTTSKSEEGIDTWIGEKITLPEINNDSINYSSDFDLPTFTIVTYIDSSNCTPCNLKLPLWKDFMDSIYENYQINVSLIFVVNSFQTDELLDIIRVNRFQKYATFIYDTKGEYISTNGITESGLNTLLLDHDNRIMVIGSPIVKNSILNIYKYIFSGKNVFDKDLNSIAHSANNTIDLGDLLQNSTKRFQIKIENLTSTTLCIDTIITSCDCVNKESFAKHFSKNIEIPFTFYATHEGEFEDYISIRINNSTVPLIYTLKGRVIKE